nr:hypothetical protein [uncultured Marinifilum sp.]
MSKQIERACDCSQALRRSNLNRISLVQNKGNQSKSKDRINNQLKRVYEAFNIPSTMLQVSVYTGILRANVCRYVAELEKQNKIQKIRSSFCPISKHRAGVYTTNEQLFKNDFQQLKMF